MSSEMLQRAFWISGFSLEVVVCLFALYRGVLKRLPLFAVYLICLVGSDVLRWSVFLSRGLATHEAFWTYWITQALLVLVRGAVIVEICSRLLSPYSGVWNICRGFLLAVGGALVFAAAWSAHANRAQMASAILTAERGLELAIVGILVFGLAFCRYYRIRPDSLLSQAALGFGVYSSVQVANNTFLNELFNHYMPVWEEIRIAAFYAALFIWLAALWKPLREPAETPILMDANAYDTAVPVLHGRLRELNARLEELLR